MIIHEKGELAFHGPARNLFVSAEKWKKLGFSTFDHTPVRLTCNSASVWRPCVGLDLLVFVKPCATIRASRKIAERHFSGVGSQQRKQAPVIDGVVC